MNQAAAVLTEDTPMIKQGCFRIVSPTAKDISEHARHVAQVVNNPLSVAGGRIKVEVFSMHDWVYGFDTNPRQRNTEKRLDRVNNTYLAEPSLSHLIVTGAICKEDDNFYKLDGHTRAELWSSGRLAAFDDKVMVIMLILDTLDEVKEYYTHFDSDKAVEKPYEKAQGALREQNLDLKSRFFAAGKFTNALRVALGYMNTGNCQYPIYVMCALLANYMSLGDNICLKSKSLRKTPLDQGMAGAMLLTLMADPVAAEEFWSLYMMDAGIKDQHGRDAVLTLRDRAADKNTKHGGDVGIRDAATAAISAFHHWKNNKRFGPGSHLVSKAKPLDFTEYVKTAHAKAGIVLP